MSFINLLGDGAAAALRLSHVASEALTGTSILRFQNLLGKHTNLKDVAAAMAKDDCFKPLLEVMEKSGTKLEHHVTINESGFEKMKSIFSRYLGGLEFAWETVLKFFGVGTRLNPAKFAAFADELAKADLSKLSEGQLKKLHNAFSEGQGTQLLAKIYEGASDKEAALKHIGGLSSHLEQAHVQSLLDKINKATSLTELDAIVQRNAEEVLSLEKQHHVNSETLTKIETTVDPLPKLLSIFDMQRIQLGLAKADEGIIKELGALTKEEKLAYIKKFTPNSDLTDAEKTAAEKVDNLSTRIQSIVNTAKDTEAAAEAASKTTVPPAAGSN
jgi:hypothetical protein